jgi:F0F1-type ATP synthase assembly protein I
MSGPRKSDAWSGMGIGWAISSTLVAGISLVGGLGYLLDRMLDTEYVITAIGIVLGSGAGTYIVYLRYGREGNDDDGRAGA